MDVTEIYIAQCDCPEIQAQFKCVNGDLIYLKRVPEICASDDVDNPLVIGTSVFLHPCDDYCIQIGFDDETFVGRDEFIWLPRQDDLQKMMGDFDDQMIIMKRCYYYDYMEDELFSEHFSVKSMEQLWLVFYMKEKHNKSWVHDKWVEA